MEEIYTVIYLYFDSNGKQKEKKISRKSKNNLITSMKKHLESNQLYKILRVSTNLEEENFSKHGIIPQK